MESTSEVLYSPLLGNSATLVFRSRNRSLVSFGVITAFAAMVIAFIYDPYFSKEAIWTHNLSSVTTAVVMVLLMKESRTTISEGGLSDAIPERSLLPLIAASTVVLCILSFIVRTLIALDF